MFGQRPFMSFLKLLETLFESLQLTFGDGKFAGEKLCCAFRLPLSDLQVFFNE